MIEQAVLDEITARTNIQDLIGSYITLKRAGSNLVGLCPFHSEKSPSFTVYTATNSFYCFGCGAGGSAITFMMRMENLPFEEAVGRLAERAGINLVHAVPGTGSKTYNRARLLEMNRAAARFFASALYAPTPAARHALAYLTEERQLPTPVIRHFGLGYCPEESGAFLDHMTSLGYRTDELVVANLLGKSERNGRLYETFRDRVMFPIIDVSGNVIAFGGRITRKDQSPRKYLNSSDTPVFKKSRNLFALNFARKCCADCMILCEGYMDVIALHAAGFENAVATLGTAITPEQARIMGRMTKRVIISYDSDEAGQKAADKATRLLEEVGLDVRILKIPGAKDPDEYIKSYGAEKFRHVLGESRTKFDHRMEQILEKYEIGIPAEKIKASDELISVIAAEYSSVTRDIYIREMAERFSLSASDIRADVERRRAGLNRELRRQQQQKIRETSLGYADHVNPDYVKMPAVARAEEAVLGMMLLSPSQTERVLHGGVSLNDEDFMTEFGRRVFGYLTARASGGEVPPMESFFSTEEMGRLAKMQASRAELGDNSDRVFEESAAILRDLSANERAKSNDHSPESILSIIQKKRGAST